MAEVMRGQRGFDLLENAVRLNFAPFQAILTGFMKKVRIFSHFGSNRPQTPICDDFESSDDTFSMLAEIQQSISAFRGISTILPNRWVHRFAK